ncbi:hypothetical protein, partial [Priestia megaterium]
RMLGIGFILTLLLSTGAQSAFATTFGTKYKGASSVESGQIHYTGKIWFYPKRTGVHEGTAKYRRDGKTIATAWTGYIPYPSGWDKTDKISASTSCYDSLSWNGPKTKFSYSFN